MTILPSPTSLVVRYPLFSAPSGSAEKYQLLELPPDLLKLVEKQDGAKPLSLTMKGRPSDDAVICTPTATYQLRTISISNSLIVLRTPSSPSSSSEERPSKRQKTSQEHTLEIRDTCHEILEMIPMVPRLERIGKILRESGWRGMGTEEEVEGSEKRVKKYTKAQLQSLIQASDHELTLGLQERNVITLNNHLLLLPPSHLPPLLSLLLSLLTLHSLPSPIPELTRASVPPIVDALVGDYNLSVGFVKGVLGLFGAIQDGAEGEEWEGGVGRVVGELGKGLLVSQLGKSIPVEEFVGRWKEEVGDSFSHHVDLKLLEGNYLLLPRTSITPPSLLPFPLSSLPLPPAERFQELFLVRPKWRAEEIAPFLKGLVGDGDKKGLEKVVGKFVRVVKEKEGVMYYRRSG